MLAAGFVAATPTPAFAGPSSIEIASYNGYRVDVMWASQSAYQGSFMWPDNASLSQEFDLLGSGGGFFRIRAAHSGQCLMLDWRSGFYANGTRIIQYPYCSAGYAPSEWSIRWFWKPNGCTVNCFITGTWYAALVNRATQRCLDMAGGPNFQAPLQQWDCITSVNQWNAFFQLYTFPTASSVPGPIIH